MSNKLSNNTFKKKTGIQNIQEYLESGRSITALEALSNFGIFRLASAIEVLRKRGMNIETETKQDPNGKTYARYMLVDGEAQQEPEAVAEAAPKVELKVGDKVVVNAGVDDYFYKAGDEGVIQVVGSEDLYVAFTSGHATTVANSTSSWFILPENVQLAAPKKELKVGARVRTLCQVLGVPAGSTGVVTDELKMVYPFNVQIDGVGTINPYNANELEVI